MGAGRAGRSGRPLGWAPPDDIPSGYDAGCGVGCGGGVGWVVGACGAGSSLSEEEESEEEDEDEELAAGTRVFSASGSSALACRGIGRAGYGLLAAGAVEEDERDS